MMIIAELHEAPATYHYARFDLRTAKALTDVSRKLAKLDSIIEGMRVELFSAQPPSSEKLKPLVGRASVLEKELVECFALLDALPEREAYDGEPNEFTDENTARIKERKRTFNRLVKDLERNKASITSVLTRATIRTSVLAFEQALALAIKKNRTAFLLREGHFPSHLNEEGYDPREIDALGGLENLLAFYDQYIKQILTYAHHLQMSFPAELKDEMNQYYRSHPLDAAGVKNPLEAEERRISSLRSALATALAQHQEFNPHVFLQAEPIVNDPCSDLLPPSFFPFSQIQVLLRTFTRTLSDLEMSGLSETDKKAQAQLYLARLKAILIETTGPQTTEKTFGKIRQYAYEESHSGSMLGFTGREDLSIFSAQDLYIALCNTVLFLANEHCSGRPGTPPIELPFKPLGAKRMEVFSRMQDVLH